VQRHADGPETMNSGLRPPASGNFSLGVWEKLGAGAYKLSLRRLEPEQSIGSDRS
jgi:hypothetical protein